MAIMGLSFIGGIFLFFDSCNKLVSSSHAITVPGLILNKISLQKDTNDLYIPPQFQNKNIKVELKSWPRLEGYYSTKQIEIIFPSRNHDRFMLLYEQPKKWGDEMSRFVKAGDKNGFRSETILDTVELMFPFDYFNSQDSIHLGIIKGDFMYPEATDGGFVNTEKEINSTLRLHIISDSSYSNIESTYTKNWQTKEKNQQSKDHDEGKDKMKWALILLLVSSIFFFFVDIK
jgi:hypothetical protein